MEKRRKNEDDTFSKKGKIEDLEVTGVSRSGRVRKKSSKLTDFESPDDLDTRFKRAHNSKISSRPSSLVPSGINMPAMIDIKSEPMLHSEYDIPTSEPESDDDMFDSNAENDSMDSMDSGGHSEGQDSDGMAELGESNLDAGQPTQSLYMLEKSKKKTVFKDGRIVARIKAQRKDKGKSRFTAYMLWAKGVRNELSRANPELDFSAISKKLGELWATVPNNEKYNWRRRAKRMAVRIAKGGKNSTPPKLESLPSQFLNKSTTKNKNTKMPSPPSNKRLMTMEDFSLTHPLPVTSPDATTSRASGMYKVTGSQPMDLAAHLKLLGESLTIIGERLKEHEGQIAVSGSLSVLLDSLLCSIGPLMCLTQQIPEIEDGAPDNLMEMLDNIAYIMPGL